MIRVVRHQAHGLLALPLPQHVYRLVSNTHYPVSIFIQAINDRYPLDILYSLHEIRSNYNKYRSKGANRVALFARHFQVVVTRRGWRRVVVMVNRY
jgi:hypothetical protein